MVARATELHGGVDILCANAGIFPNSNIVDMALEEWDEALDINLKGSFMAVKACLPGNVMTEGMDEAGDDYIRRMAVTVPMKKLGTIEDIAYAALYFASDEAGYVTGQTIIVDGGQELPEALTD